MVYLVILVILIILFIIFGKLEIKIDFIRNGNDNNLVLSFFIFFKLIKYKIEIPIVKVNKEDIKEKVQKKRKYQRAIEESIEKFKLENIDEYYEQFKVNKAKFAPIQEYITEKIEMSKLVLKLELGLGDAYYSAIATGTAWSLLEGIVAFFHNINGIEKTNIEINTNFNKTVINVDFSCILKLRIVNTIITAIKFLFIIMKDKRSKKKSTGGEINGGASY